MSMDGFPKAKGAVFQKTAGRAAFSVFKSRGRMRHGLSTPIPGAPALTTSTDWGPAAARLRQTIIRFNAYGGPLQPHFAYGPLTKVEYALAHHMHVVNHREEILVV
jgi:hypothetical protein